MTIDALKYPDSAPGIMHYLTHPGFLTGLMITTVCEIILLFEHAYQALRSRFDKGPD